MGSAGGTGVRNAGGFEPGAGSGVSSDGSPGSVPGRGVFKDGGPESSDGSSGTAEGGPVSSDGSDGGAWISSSVAAQTTPTPNAPGIAAMSMCMRAVLFIATSSCSRPLSTIGAPRCNLGLVRASDTRIQGDFEPSSGSSDGRYGLLE